MCTENTESRLALLHILQRVHALEEQDVHGFIYSFFSFTIINFADGSEVRTIRNAETEKKSE